MTIVINDKPILHKFFETEEKRIIKQSEQVEEILLEKYLDTVRNFNDALLEGKNYNS